MLIQIPVFFSLYKVLVVTIEMRQAPFFGWIHDLSAPDPTSFLNLFGLPPALFDSAFGCRSPLVPAHRHLADPDGHDAMDCRRR
jgi:membrane protein insertase Oxa1/YidC/SpoIIIJ